MSEKHLPSAGFLPHLHLFGRIIGTAVKSSLSVFSPDTEICFQADSNGSWCSSRRRSARHCDCSLEAELSRIREASNSGSPHFCRGVSRKFTSACKQCLWHCQAELEKIKTFIPETPGRKTGAEAGTSRLTYVPHVHLSMYMRAQVVSVTALSHLGDGG